MEKFQTFGAYTPEESQRERDHKALARRVAAEGIVLLKNDGVLPLATKKVAIYGPGSRIFFQTVSNLNILITTL